MSKMKKTIIIIIITAVITGVISIGCTYAATSYAISASKVGYLDNSSIGVDNVQAAIDGTCTKVDTRLSSLEKNKQNNITTTSSTITKNISGTFSGCSNIYKYGNIVMYNCAFVPSSSVSTNTAILTFPSGYRPVSGTPVVIIASGTGTAYNANLSTSGVLSLANNTLESRWYQFSVIFIAA